jgi:hypothetical protein
MLGRKNYTREELEQAKAAIEQQLSAYKKLAKAVDGTNGRTPPALEAFEPLFFNSLMLTLDRYFVHRLRMVTGKDTSPLNELELLADSLMNNGGVLRGSNAIKYDRDASILKLQIGDSIELRAADFERLASSSFEELERKFL